MNEPRRRELDDDLEAEIESALDGRSIHEIEATADQEERVLGEGQRTGRVVDVGETDVLVEFGAHEQGVCPLGHFAQRPRVGDIFPFHLQGLDQASGLVQLSLGQHAPTHARWANLDVGRVVRGRVSGHNQGGLELEVAGHQAFMPISQISLERVEDASVYVGQALEGEIIELDRSREKIVLSRRALLERQREESRYMLAEGLAVGSTVRGKITRLEPYGAFVDLGGGVEGLLHVSNLSWVRVEHPEAVVQLGQEVAVQVLSIEEAGRRIGLGLKQLQGDPYDGFRAEHPEQALVQGKVVRVVDFGAFVELAPGVEGLLHRSEMATHHVSRVRRVVNEGDRIEVRIAGYEPERRRISLSLLTEKGRLLGDETEADEETTRQYLVSPGSATSTSGTSLGDLLRQALEKPPEQDPPD